MSTPADPTEDQTDEFKAGYAAGQEATRLGTPLTLDQVRKMTPAEINGRRDEVETVMRSTGRSR